MLLRLLSQRVILIWVFFEKLGRKVRIRKPPKAFLNVRSAVMVFAGLDRALRRPTEMRAQRAVDFSSHVRLPIPSAVLAL